MMISAIAGVGLENQSITGQADAVRCNLLMMPNS